jgi:hypothetical protein
MADEMLSKALIDAIKAGVATEAIGINDAAPWFTRPVYNPPDPDQLPLATALTIHTLQGLVDYLVHDENFDGVIQDKVVIHVVDETEVRIVAPLKGYHRQRETLVTAKFNKVIGVTFSFGKFVDSQDFVIALRSLFLPSDDIDNVIKKVGRMTSERVKEYEDDGITQTVTARKGAATVANVELPLTLSLQPYRTFREIDQPASSFFLRVQDEGEDEPPSCALFETDGGQWKLTAIERIRGFFEAAGVEVPIIA